MFFSDNAWSRRHFLRWGTVAFSVSLSGWLGRLAHAAADNRQRKRSCILLWMNGGPATIDLWDLKPGHVNGGPYREIATSTPGLRIGEHLPGIARWSESYAIIRSMTTREGDHGRAAYFLRTGNLPRNGTDYPTLGSLVAKELAPDWADLPPFVSIAPQRFLSPNAHTPGFLGPRYAPLLVADNQRAAQGDRQNADQQLRVQNLGSPGMTTRQTDERRALLGDLEEDFLSARPGAIADSHRAAFDAAVRLMQPQNAAAFDLSRESARLRDRYGHNLFGQGCLLARRLVERGIPFVEVTLDGWDTHANNFDAVRNQCAVLDSAWSMLMDDLQIRGLLDSTLLICMGEFGRTPRINQQQGRDHYPNAFSAVLAGGGIRGGQAIGRTGRDGMRVEEHPVSVPDLLATICQALGIDHRRQNMSNAGRPIRIVDGSGTPIREVLS
jgi:hypothetical protein